MNYRLQIHNEYGIAQVVIVNSLDELKAWVLWESKAENRLNKKLLELVEVEL